MRIFLLELIALCSILVGVDSYKIDDDCGDDREFVKERVDAAFALAAEGHKQLTSIRSPEIGDVFTQLFGRGIEERGQAKLIEPKLERLVAVSTLDGELPEGAAEVTFYCTTKRIGKREDGRFVNKDKNYVYPEGEITNRWASCYDLRPPTLMITTNPIVDLSLGSEIQICPWFLTQSRDWKISDLKSLNKVVWGGLAEIVMPAVTKAQYTPIDAFSLFEKVALHELTHTRQSGGSRNGVTVDMNPAPYGWKNCKELAQIFKDSNFDLSKDPQQNADSVALLCSAIRLIGEGVKIKENGDLEGPKNSKRRDSLMYPVSWVA